MAASPDWKVYDARGRYQAATKEPEAAAVLVSFYGYGATVRFNHAWIVWTEGKEQQEAAESYDYASVLMITRLQDKQQEQYDRIYNRKGQ